MRRLTNTAQNPPDEIEEAIREFHRMIHYVQLADNGDGPQEEKFKLYQIANVDQTPLPFSFTAGPTYETTNASTVWVHGGDQVLTSDSVLFSLQFLLMGNQE